MKCAPTRLLDPIGCAECDGNVGGELFVAAKNGRRRSRGENGDDDSESHQDSPQDRPRDVWSGCYFDQVVTNRRSFPPRAAPENPVMNVFSPLRKISIGLMLVASSAVSASAQLKEGSAAIADLRLNQVQVIGSHNSYHLPPGKTELELMDRDGKEHSGLEYGGMTLSEQFDRGVRQIELDLYPDWEGGRFAKPGAFAKAAELGLEAPAAHDPEDELKQPGTKVLHQPDLDFRSTVLTLKSALTEVDQWSQAHPDHYPIFILLELKGGKKDWAGDGLTKLEWEILQVVGKKRIVTPDAVRGGDKTLREAVLSKGWPTMEDSAGRLMFGLDNEDELRDDYLAKSPKLRGRLLFPSCDKEESPAAAWFKMNDAKKEFKRIQARVKKGFMVRTRSDVGLKKKPALRELAIASGAQFVSSDFAGNQEHGFGVAFPDGTLLRINPLTED